MTNQKLD